MTVPDQEILRDEKVLRVLEKMFVEICLNGPNLRDRTLVHDAP